MIEVWCVWRDNGYSYDDHENDLVSVHATEAGAVEEARRRAAKDQEHRPWATVSVGKPEKVVDGVPFFTIVREEVKP